MMELVYIYIKEFRNIKNTGINLSNKFTITFEEDEEDKEKSKLDIKKNENVKNIYPEHILNVNAFLGKNGSGKTNLLELIGMRIEDRYEYKENEKERTTIDIFNFKAEPKVKNSNYFFLYHVKDNIFHFEGNYIDLHKTFKGIKKELRYWTEQNWFYFKASYNFEKKELTLEHWEREKRTAIIYFRDLAKNINSISLSYEDEDEQKLAVARRTCNIRSKYIWKRIEFILSEIKSKNNKLYLDTQYILNIETNNLYDIDEIGHYYDDIILNGYDYQKKVCKKMHQYANYVFRVALRTIGNEVREKVEEELREKLKEITTKFGTKDKNYELIKDYYIDIIDSIYKFLDIERKDFLIEKFKQIIYIIEGLKNNQNINILNEKIKITIDENLDFSSVKEFIDLSLNGAEPKDIPKKMDPFNGFFHYKINHLSNGEETYLGLITSIDEQIKEFNNKEEYILLLDEPENTFHPELARIFIKTLIEFLSQYENTKFQIIIATHSPFLISDIPKENIKCLQRNVIDEKPEIIKYLQRKGIDENSEIKDMEINTFGQNIHTLLKSGFFLESTMGEYASTKIKGVIQDLNQIKETRKIKERKIKIKNLNETKTEKKAKSKDIKIKIIRKRKFKKINKKEIEYIISLIGEPIIKRKLELMYKELFSESIEYYKEVRRKLIKDKETIKEKVESKELSNMDETIKLLDRQIKELNSKIGDKND